MFVCNVMDKEYAKTYLRPRRELAEAMVLTIFVRPITRF